MKKLTFSSLVFIGLCLCCLNVFAQTIVPAPQKYQLQNYSLGAMLVGVRIPGNWDAAPIIIGKADNDGVLTFDWPATVPGDLKNATDQLNYVIQTGNCDPDENGQLENSGADYFLFNRIWLMHPETKDVQGQLMAASNDTIRKWMHRPDDEKTTKGTYAYLLYAFQANTLRSTCQFESWITPEGQSEITLEHKFENDLKVTKGFQFVIYDNKEVHPYEGMQPKWQQVSASPVLPENVSWKVKE
jgi:hypothetical protein